MPPVVKNLLILNVLMFFAKFTFERQGIQLDFILGLSNPASPNFEPYQIITYMFMHGDLGHLFFNMFALVTFGSILERMWGPKRFISFYFITGIGAMFLYSLVNYVEYLQLVSKLPADVVEVVKENGQSLFKQGMNYSDETVAALNLSLNMPAVGASGALYGIMIAFGMLFPNTEMMLIFLPIPIKAKYFIPVMIFIELYLGVMQYSWDNVAHFAHLGGALIGGLIVYFQKKKDRRNFY
ncbi:MAG: rhomboid family intramembrane serine protease [Flavobacteriales bacterium]|nr:rhomboid family intramembrane serine protease [Flavobacteriales bacterium]